MTSPQGFVQTLARADHDEHNEAATPEQFTLGEVPYAALIHEATLIPGSAVAADAVNFRTFTLINSGQAGEGTTPMGTLTTAAGWTANDEQFFTLSGTLTVAHGDVLSVQETVDGTGQVHPDLQVLVKGTRL